jgi:hypothetical protein
MVLHVSRLSLMSSVHMHMNMRIVRGLITPVVLGWDFFGKYGAHLDPAKGKLIFMNDKSAPLIPNTEQISGCYYRVHEDLVVPGNSKMHREVELMLDGDDGDDAHLGQSPQTPTPGLGGFYGHVDQSLE